jgi:hypothetical protein
VIETLVAQEKAQALLLEARVMKEKNLQIEREKHEESVDQEEGQGDMNIERDVT